MAAQLDPPRKPPTAPTRKVVAAAVVLIGLGAAAATWTSTNGAAFMNDLDVAQPALARHPPIVIDPATPRLSRRVFLVIIDGLRLDKSYEVPYLDDLRRHGLDLEAQSHYPTWSRPNYVSILTGVPPPASGVRTNQHRTPVMLDSLMDRVHAAGMSVAYASDSALVPSLFLRPHRASPEVIDTGELAALDVDMSSPFDDARYAPWSGGFLEAGTAIVDGHADLVVLLIGAVDNAGHAEGADSPHYREAVEISDRALARVLAHVDLTQDTIVVLADHGHTGRGGHGGIEPEVMAVPLIFAGAGIDVAGSAPDARLIDISPTVSALLGLPAPGHGLGNTLDGVLSLDATAKERRDAADRARVAISTLTVAAAEARAEAELTEQRGWRLGLVGGLVLVAIVLAVLLIRARVLRLDLRVLLISVPTFFVVYYTLIGTLGQRFSPSLVPGEGHLTVALIKYGVIGMVVQVAASLYALRRKGTLASRLSAANGIALVGLLSALIPAGIVWAYFPAPYVVLPGPVWLVLIPAVQVAVACATLNIVLTLGAEFVVFMAGATRRDHPYRD